MQAAADRYNIRIYAGAELRFDGSENDYLLYGFDDELLSNPEKTISEGLEVFSERAGKIGALLMQAHPFRGKCYPAPPGLLDGIEVLNTNPRHESYNDLARRFAERYDLLMIGGSDCHRPGDEALSGIISEYLPTDEADLVALLRSGRYSIIQN